MDMDKMQMEGEELMEEKKKSVPKLKNKYERVFQPCLAELIGTMFFVFVGCVSVIENVPSAGRLQPALAHGLALAIMVAVMGNISGSHFNPTFTIAIYLCGGIELMMAGPYLVSQLIGGVLGAGMARVMTPADRYMNASGAAFDILRPESNSQLYSALFGEMAMTCMFTMVVLLGAVNGKTKTPLAPFLVGGTVIVNVLAGGDISGTCLNPARAFGPAVIANYWTYHWVYWAGPIGGGMLAAILLRLILGDEKVRLILKS